MGSPRTIYVKFLVDVNQWMANVPNAVEILPKISNRLSRAHERYRRQTDGRAIAYSEREHEFTFAKNCQAAAGRHQLAMYSMI